MGCLAQTNGSNQSIEVTRARRSICQNGGSHRTSEAAQHHVICSPGQRRVRSDVGRRFEEPDAIGRTFAETGRGTSATDLLGYQIPDEAVPGRFVRPNGGDTDFARLMSEAGDAPEVRRALQGQLVSEVQRRGALKSPEALSRFLADHNVQLEQFPETRRALEEAGASKTVLDDAIQNAEALRRDITPGGKEQVV